MYIISRFQAGSSSLGHQISPLRRDYRPEVLHGRSADSLAIPRELLHPCSNRLPVRGGLDTGRQYTASNARPWQVRFAWFIIRRSVYISVSLY